MSYCVCSIVQVGQKLLPDDVFEFTISNLDVELPYVVLVWAFSSSADHHPARVELPPLGEGVCVCVCVCVCYVCVLCCYVCVVMFVCMTPSSLVLQSPDPRSVRKSPVPLPLLPPSHPHPHPLPQFPLLSSSQTARPYLLLLLYYNGRYII